VLVDPPAPAARAEVVEAQPVAAREHRVGERRGLGAVEPAEVDGHEQRGHLVVRHGAARVRVGERPPLGRGDATAVALALDEFEHRHGCVARGAGGGRGRAAGRAG
jgi:hypothetical protein